MPRKLCDFTAVGDLADQVAATHRKVQTDMETWARTAGLTEADWQDGAGTKFGEVSRAWGVVAAAHQEMQLAVRQATVQAVAENAATVARSAARFG
ncbi:MAG TPA: hypothetical protein VGD15_24865 [Kribbella sp.]|jgi:hypothetical protein